MALQAIRVATSRLPEGAGAAGELLARAQEQLAIAVTEIRELARGLHPPVLTEDGLAAALAQLVPRLDGAFSVELDVPAYRFEPQLEACSYYLVAEALANAAKYSGASAAAVSVTAAGDVVTVDVADDGCGGACPTAGGGLEGLAERVSALGGSLTIESPAGRGTRLQAEIPSLLHSPRRASRFAAPFGRGVPRDPRHPA